MDDVITTHCTFSAQNDAVLFYLLYPAGDDSVRKKFHFTHR